MSLKRRLAVPLLLALLPLPSCGISAAHHVRYLSELEPPARYNHPYDGQVVERVMPVAEVRSVCMSMGLDFLTVACSWQSNDTCYVVIPNDGQAPVDTYRRHEIAHCNGWPANHPRDDISSLSDTPETTN